MFDYESDDDNFGILSDNEGESFFAKTESIIRENMYISSWDPVVFRIRMYFRNFRALAWAIRQHTIENKFKVYKYKFERAQITLSCTYYRCP